jgi:hypothetical protein
VFRVLAGVSGVGGECFSWVGGGSSAVTGLLLIQVPGVVAVLTMWIATRTPRTAARRQNHPVHPGMSNPSAPGSRFATPY